MLRSNIAIHLSRHHISDWFPNHSLRPGDGQRSANDHWIREQGIPWLQSGGEAVLACDMTRPLPVAPAPTPWRSARHRSGCTARAGGSCDGCRMPGCGKGKCHEREGAVSARCCGSAAWQQAARHPRSWRRGLQRWLWLGPWF